MRASFLLCFWGSLWAQLHGLDSIRTLLEQGDESPDPQVEAIARQTLSLLSRHRSTLTDTQFALYTGRAMDLLAYGLAYRGLIDSALFWCDSAYRLLYQYSHFHKAAEVKGNLAYYYHQRGDIVRAITAHQEVGELARRYQNPRLLYYTYNNLGGLFTEIGLQDTAVALHQKALLLADSLRDSNLKALSLNNLASVYETQKLWDYARRYLQEALAIRLALGDSGAVANTLSNLGRLYLYEQKNDSALFFLRKAYHVACTAKNIPAQSTAASNMATAFIQKSQWDSAEVYLYKVLVLRERGTPTERFKTYRALVQLYQRWAEAVSPAQRPPLYQKALFWSQKAYPLLRSREVYDLEAVEGYFSSQHELYSNLGQYDKALSAYKRYITYRDSLRNLRAQRKAIESRYQYEWLQHERSLREEMLRQQIVAEEKQKRNRLWIGFLLTLSLILTLGGIVLFQLYRQTRHQRDLITYQKSELERSYALISEQHEELMSSLRYAKRIQRALLPDAQTLQRVPFSHALWYQPQTEVGGDFYWIRAVGDSQYWMVLGDCTGHGVPGGFMTVLAITLLERALEEGFFHLPDLAQFLHASFQKLLHTERQEAVRDGMEGSFLRIDLLRQEVEILNAGAIAWWIPPGRPLQEIPPTGPGIGHTLAEKTLAWQTYTLSFTEGGRLVLATDGTRDQLGPQRKKWGRKSWRELQEKTRTLSPEEALQVIRTEWEAFREGTPQIDDVSVWLLDLPSSSHKVA